MSLNSKIYFPPLAVSVYKILLEKDGQTAKEIALKLKILPHSVYRAARTLRQLGVIDWVGKKPTRFQVKPSEEALNNYLLLHQEWFYHLFLRSSRQNNRDYEQNFDVCFIQDKKTLNELEIKDFQSLKQSGNFIVSGLEAPAEIILANKRAIERGVTIKTLVQKVGLANKEMLSIWKKMGIEVKAIKSIEARLFIFDQRITYLLTYQPQKKQKAVGVRLVYPPIACLLNELFLSRWEQAKKV